MRDKTLSFYVKTQEVLLKPTEVKIYIRTNLINEFFHLTKPFTEAS